MNKEQEIQTIVSKQALERFSKDKFLKQNRNWYNKQIILLVESRLNRPTERIGDFNITPRGHEKKRIAWHFEVREETITLFIDGLLYHVIENKYVDNWNIKAANKEIRLKDYGPYLPFVRL